MPSQDSEVKSAPSLHRGKVLLGLPLILLAGHGYQARSLEEFVYHAMLIAVALTALAVVGLFFLWRSEGFKPISAQNTARILLLVPLLISIAASFYYALWVGAIDLFRYLVSHSSGQASLRAAASVAAAVLGGAALFYFRLRFRSVYGLTEALAGVFIAAYKGFQVRDADGDFFVAILTAGVYLVVRGLDNVHQGLTGAVKDPIAMWLWDQARKRFTVLPTINSPDADRSLVINASTTPRKDDPR